MCGSCPEVRFTLWKDVSNERHSQNRHSRFFSELVDYSFLLGGLLVYALVNFFGFVILRYGVVFLWMFLNMFSTGTIGLEVALASTAVLAAGLSMILRPPQKMAS